MSNSMHDLVVAYQFMSEVVIVDIISAYLRRSPIFYFCLGRIPFDRDTVRKIRNDPPMTSRHKQTGRRTEGRQEDKDNCESTRSKTFAMTNKPNSEHKQTERQTSRHEGTQADTQADCQMTEQGFCSRFLNQCSRVKLIARKQSCSGASSKADLQLCISSMSVRFASQECTSNSIVGLVILDPSVRADAAGHQL